MDSTQLCTAESTQAHTGDKTLAQLGDPSRDNEKQDDRDKANLSKITMPANASIGTHRSTRYKEKFQALREIYDKVTAIHDERERELAIATAKCKQLQAENDLLLDVISLTIPSVPRNFTPSPLDQQSSLPYPLDRTGGGGGSGAHPAYMNGHSNNNDDNNHNNMNNSSNNISSNSTVRHRPLEPYDAEFIVREPNGRLP